MSGDQEDAAAAPTSAAQVIEIARAVTSQLAPDELPVFDQVAGAWSSDTERGPSGPGASLKWASASKRFC